MKTLSRIKKLLRLAEKAGTAQEAAAAAAHAHRLAEKHRIDLATLDDDDEPDIMVGALDEGARLAQWKIDLAIVVAEVNVCRVVVEPDGRTVVQLVGRADDQRFVRVLYSWLVSEIQRLTRASGLRGRRALDSFREGAIYAVEDALEEEQLRARKAGVRRAVTALVRYDREVEDFAEELCEGREQAVGYLPDDFDAEAYVAGAVHGRQIDVTASRSRLAS